MDFSNSQYIQLILAIMMVLMAFVAAYIAPEKPVVSFLVLLIPFQLVTSRFGTINTGLTLLVFVAFFLNKRIRHWPLFGFAALLLLVYLVSFTQVHRSTYLDHILYMVAMTANFAIFYIVYNYVSRTVNPKDFFNLLITLNVIVAIYCYIQLLVGLDGSAIMGGGELSLQQNRADARLAGPFTAVGITAEYLVIQIFILLYMILNDCTRRQKLFWSGLIAANFAFLIATGNRGGILILLIGTILFFYLFRREFGGSRLLIRGIIGGGLFAVMALVIISFTQFNVLFERLTDTEVREGLPDTRAVIWPLAWERISEKPVLGYGPRIRLIEEFDRRIPGHEFMPYPHSTYLFILYTLGAVGLTAHIIFMAALLLRVRRGMSNKHPDDFLRGVPKLSMLILTLVIIDQAKVSMFRFNLSDYQQYTFALFAGLLALTNMTQNHERSNQLNNDSRILQKKLET